MAERLRTWFSRAWSWMHMSRVDEEFTEEVNAHVDLLVEENRRRGDTPEEARRRALVQLGGITQLRESHREQRGLPWLDRLAQDLRYAGRMFRKAPAFTLFAGAALALGIGATTALFSVANAVLLRALPYRDPGRLAFVWQDDTVFGFPRNNPTPYAFDLWRRNNTVFDDTAALSTESFNLVGRGDPEQLRGNTVTANFFAVLGAEPASGRTFTDDDGRPGTPLTAVISHGLWTRRFGADPGLVGQDLLLNGAKYTVVGIMPRDFQFLDPVADVWVAAQWTPKYIDDHQTSHFLTVIGRLRPGVTFERANSAMTLLGARLSSGQLTDLGGVVVPLREQLVGESRNPVLILFAAVAFVLLIACANVANLLLARGSARTREMAVRLALGASRGRVVEQMLVESVLLSSVAGAAGLAVAFWTMHPLSKLIPEGLPASGARLDGTVLAFTAAVSIATGVVFGVLPAIRSSKVNLTTSLRQASPQSGGGGHRLRAALVVSEIAVAIVLLAGAALMIRSLQHLVDQDPGFHAAQVITMQTRLPLPKYADNERRSAFYRDVLARVQRLPGVVAAGYSTTLPLANPGGGSIVFVENHPADPKHQRIANVRVVSPGYFTTIGMTLRAGRLITAADNATSMRVVVVNATMASSYWPGEDPLGRRFKTGASGPDNPWFTVVGVVGDMRQGGMNTPVRPEAYFPFEQIASFAPTALAVRTAGDPASIVAALRQQIWAVDKDQPVSAVRPLDDLVDASVSPFRVQTILFAAFGAVALLLAAFGIYGVLSFAVMQRIPEFGVRIAVGAGRSDIVRMVIVQGLRLFGAGLAIGLAAALTLSRVMSHLLIGIKPTDPFSYVAVVSLLSIVTLAACYLPARRATAVEPLQALRWE